MKKILSIRTFLTLVIVILSVVTLVFADGCKESEKVAAKSGAQLWSENCQRCHNTPSPTTFSDEQWKTVGMHMQTRALLTNNERDKIVEFMQQFNHM